jgi:hypothetical protein
MDLTYAFFLAAFSNTIEVGKEGEDIALLVLAGEKSIFPIWSLLTLKGR